MTEASFWAKALVAGLLLMSLLWRYGLFQLIRLFDNQSKERKWIGTSRCDVPGRVSAAGFSVRCAPTSDVGARTAQRAIPTRSRVCQPNG